MTIMTMMKMDYDDEKVAAVSETIICMKNSSVPACKRRSQEFLSRESQNISRIFFTMT